MPSAWTDQRGEAGDCGLKARERRNQRPKQSYEPNRKEENIS